jgi:hypothetical protein
MIEHENVFDLNAILHPPSARCRRPSEYFNRRETRHPRLLGFGCRRHSVQPGVTGATRFTSGDDR